MDLWRSDVWQNLIICLGGKTFGPCKYKNSTMHTLGTHTPVNSGWYFHSNIYSFSTVIQYTAWVWRVCECVCIFSCVCVTVYCVRWAGNTHIRVDTGFCSLIGVCVCLSMWVCERKKGRIRVCVAVLICQLCGLVLAGKGKGPPLPLPLLLPFPPICPVRVSHKVQSLLIVPVPDGRFMEDESWGTNQISSPVWG